MVAKNALPIVLVIGLDVGDGELIRKWSQQGVLPVLNSLMRDGAWGWLNTTAETLHISAWPSLYTGTLPGKHGVYYTFQPAPGHQGSRRFGPDQYGQPTFWQILDGAGKRCIVFDAPYTHPQKNFGGIQIFEWGTWAWYWKPMSTPLRVMNELVACSGSYPLGFEANRVGLGALDLKDLHARLTRAATAKSKAVQWLMANKPWDLFLVVFGETHPAAHYFWPRENGPEAERSSTFFLKDIYQAIDRAIGEILQKTEGHATVFVVSGDGAGPNYGGWHLLPQVLEKIGLTASHRRIETEGSAGLVRSESKRDFVKMVRDLVPSDLRQSISHRLPAGWRDLLMARWEKANIDWSRSRAFCLPTDLEGCIRVNLKFREPEGIVNPGEEYEEVCRKVAASLNRLINPMTGHPVVRQVIRTDKAYPGERRHYLPDLIALWSDEKEIKEVYSPEIGTVSANSPDVRAGTHRPQGFIIARGPNTRRGQILEGGHIVDFAPTILARFGLAHPTHMDGQVWKGLIAG